MILRTPDYYELFKCIAGKCPDSCCQGWEVDADKKSLDFYSSLDSGLEIKKRIDSVLDEDEFNNTIFRLADRKRCPFLNDDNLCDMHIAIGGEHTPYTCRTFPRFINDYGAVREMGLSLSCPVVSDIVFEKKTPLRILDSACDFELTLNEIDAQTYFFLLNERKKVFEILQNRKVHIKDRLCNLLDYALELQNKLDEIPSPDDTISFLDVFRNPEVINPQWEIKVNNYTKAHIQNEVYNEQIACYFIFKYFLEAVYDYDVLSKAKMAVIGVLITSYFGNDSWTIHLWSKETEHSQYNMDRYKKLLKSAKCLSVSALKEMILY